MTDTDQMTALAIPAKSDLAAMFRKSDGLDPIIARIEAEVRAHVPDISTAKGRKAIASLAYKIAQSKTALDDAGKALNEEARSHINAVDAERRKARDRLDKLKDEARAPLDKWEADEAARVESLKSRLDRLTAAAPAEESSSAYAAMIARVEGAVIDETWQEFVADAAIAKDRTLARLRSAMSVCADRERLEAENERLKAEADALAEDERRRREADAAEQQRIAAEKAEEERRAQIEKEKQEAAERASREAEDRAKVEAEKIQREANERAEAERRAAAEREAELQRQIDEAKLREESAAQAERDRIAAEKRAEDDARAKREADAVHRANIKRAIVSALESMRGNISPETLADALMDGKIPHTKVTI